MNHFGTSLWDACIPEKGRLNGLRMLVPRRRARAAAQTGRSLGHALRIKQMPLVVLRGEPIYKLTGEHSWVSPNGSVFMGKKIVELKIS